MVLLFFFIILLLAVGYFVLPSGRLGHFGGACINNYHFFSRVPHPALCMNTAELCFQLFFLWADFYASLFIVFLEIY